MLHLVFAILGAVLAVPYVLFARRSRAPRRVLGAGLVIAALVYVAFALFGVVSDLAVEALGVVLFGIVALLGIRYSPYILALGWASHVAWDVLLHELWWYPLLCIGFDLAVAIGAATTRRAPAST